MNRQEFLRRADECLERVTDALADVDADELDASPADGVLTLEFADRQRFVLNRQTAANQMWFAAGARAWHFDWDAARGQWIDDKGGSELYALVAEAIAAKLGRTLKI